MKDLIKALLVIVFSLSLLAYDHYTYKNEKKNREIDAKTKTNERENIDMYRVSSESKLNDTLTFSPNYLILAKNIQDSDSKISY